MSKPVASTAPRFCIFRIYRSKILNNVLTMNFFFEKKKSLDSCLFYNCFSFLSFLTLSSFCHFLIRLLLSTFSL